MLSCIPPSSTATAKRAAPLARFLEIRARISNCVLSVAKGLSQACPLKDTRRNPPQISEGSISGRGYLGDDPSWPMLKAIPLRFRSRSALVPHPFPDWRSQTRVSASRDAKNAQGRSFSRFLFQRQMAVGQNQWYHFGL